MSLANWFKFYFANGNLCPKCDKRLSQIGFTGYNDNYYCDFCGWGKK